MNIVEASATRSLAQRQILRLILIMVGVALTVGAFSIWLLYRVAFEEGRARLIETAQSQARLIEAVARFDARNTRSDYPGGAFEATLSQIVDAHERYKGFGKTGEFTLAKRDGDKIVFLLGHRHFDLDTPKPVPWNAKVAEPMRRALSGRSGTVVGLDYRGETVLAAHEPVAVLNIGIVAKIDMAEINAPFFKAGMAGGAGALVIVLVGAIIFRRMSAPIIQRERAELALRNSEERVRGILENVPDGIATIDDRGIIQSFNSEAELMFGYGADDVIGQNVRILMPEPDHGQHDQYIRNYLNSGDGKILGAAPREVMAQRKDGGTFPMELTVGAMGSGINRTFIGAMRDITVRRELEDEKNNIERQLRQAQKMDSLGTLAGGTAHEFNNLLVPIIGLTELTICDLAPDSLAHRNLTNVLESAKRAGELVENILYFCREDISEPETLQLRRVVDNSLELITAVLPSTIEVSAHLEDVGCIRGVATHIHQIVMNLTSNAAHAIEGHTGHLIIRLSPVTFDAGFDTRFGVLAPGAYARLSVEDTGCGMDDDTLNRIFEPFFTTKEVGQGTGLGLSIIHGLITSHGGMIDIATEPGRGTTVDVYLPVIGGHGRESVGEPLVA